MTRSTNNIRYEEKPRPQCFTNQLNSILQSFPKEENNILRTIDSIKKNPVLPGKRIQGWGELHLRKMRIGLKAYNIGKSGGLRLIWLLNEKFKWIIMIAIYEKRDFTSENKLQEMLKRNVNEIKTSLSI